MTITDIRIRKIIPEEDFVVISITIDGQLAVHDIKIVQGDERLFVAMPSRKMIGVFRDIVHPITPEARQQIESEILSTFLAEVEARENQSETGAE